jgi:hypothetical protein
MKLLPEVPTQEMEIDGIEASLLGRPSVDDSTYVNSIYQAMYAAAPDVKDEPVAYARTFNGEIMVDGLTLFADTADGELRQMNAEFPDDADKRKVIPLYAHPSPRIAELEAEVVKLRGAITNHKADFITDRELYEALK